MTRYTGETIWLPRLFRDGKAVLTDAHFERCTLTGPAVVFLLRSQVNGCSWGPGSVEALCWEIDPARDEIVGALGVRPVELHQLHLPGGRLRSAPRRAASIPRGHQGGVVAHALARMSGRSRAGKPGMVERDPAAYGPLVRRHFNNLVTSGRLFDEGHDEAIIAMAPSLRTLFLGGAPLLNRVCKLGRTQFDDTAELGLDDLPPGFPKPIASIGGGLTVMSLSASGARVMPRCSVETVAPRTRIYKDWWERDPSIVGADNHRRYTRRWLVDHLANSDVVHVDGYVLDEYDQLTRDKHGWQAEINGMAQEIQGDVATASLRQIAWETQHTLERIIPEIALGKSTPNAPSVT